MASATPWLPSSAIASPRKSTLMEAGSMAGSREPAASHRRFPSPSGSRLSHSYPTTSAATSPTLPARAVEERQVGARHLVGRPPAVRRAGTSSGSAAPISMVSGRRASVRKLLVTRRRGSALPARRAIGSAAAISCSRPAGAQDPGPHGPRFEVAVANLAVGNVGAQECGVAPQRKDAAVEGVELLAALQYSSWALVSTRGIALDEGRVRVDVEVGGVVDPA